MRLSTSSPEKRNEPSTLRTQLCGWVGTRECTSSRIVRAGFSSAVGCISVPAAVEAGSSVCCCAK